MIDGYRYAVQLLFDSPSERVIESAIDDLRSLGLVNPTFIGPKYQPHLSLAVFREMDKAFAAQLIELLAREFTAFELQFTHLQTFSAEVEVLSLGLDINDKLRDIHRRLHQLFQGRPESCWEYYLPNKWIPHCGLLVDTDKENIQLGRHHLQQGNLPCVLARRICMTGFTEQLCHELTKLPE